LCRTAKNIFLEQPNLLRIEGPVYIATGTLGSFKDLSNVIDKCGPPKFMNYLFLGDYAGRYNRSTECLVALLTYKIMMPNNFFMLRGCYENIKMAMNYNLYTELS
jgi:serine/threonine-protein phosphatase PP1 catalytic subunit